MVLVYFARRHRHQRTNLPSERNTRWISPSAARSSVICSSTSRNNTVSSRLIRKRESRDHAVAKPTFLRSWCRASARKGILIHIYLYEIPCARAHVPHKDSPDRIQYPQRFRKDTEKITNQFVFGRSLNRNCVGHDEVIQPPHPIMLSEPFPPTAFTVHNGFVAAARVAMDAVES